jgi:hypothetical protein
MDTQLKNESTDPVRFELQYLCRKSALAIGAGDFDNAKRAYLVNQALLAIEEKYALVLQNYVEFESVLHGLALRNLVLKVREWSDYVDGIQLVNGSLLNLLSSTKAYLDQIPQHLNIVFGDSSAQAAAFARLTNDEFDAHFAYRVVSALRNHLQHGDFPVKWLEFAGRWTMDGAIKDSCMHQIAAHLSTDDLISNGKIRGATRAELQALGEPRLDVKPLVRAYLSSMARLHLSVRKSVEEETQANEDKVRGLIAKAKDEASALQGGLAAVAVGEAKQVLERIPVFAENIDRRKHLQKRSSVLTNMEKHFLTGESAADPDAMNSEQAARSEGVLMAVSVLVAMHDQIVAAADVVSELGLSQADCSKLDDFDKQNLRKIQGTLGGKINLLGL